MHYMKHQSRNLEELEQSQAGKVELAMVMAYRQKHTSFFIYGDFFFVLFKFHETPMTTPIKHLLLHSRRDLILF